MGYSQRPAYNINYSFNPCTFAVQVVRGRWFTFFASILVMSVSGATYIFSLYSKDIKTSLRFDQRALNTISFFKDLGANVGVLSGLINEVTPPWVVLALGAGMNLFGYLMIYFSMTGKLTGVKLWQMCLYVFVGANSQAFANTGAVVTSVKNFPDSRGMVLGLLKGFAGLSGAIFTQMYYAFYGGSDSKSLILLVAWLPAAVSVAFVHTIRIMPAGVKPRKMPFFCFLYISIALALFLMVIIIVEKRVSFSEMDYGVFAGIVIFLLCLPMGVVIKEHVKMFRAKKLELESNNPIAVSVEKSAVVPVSAEATTAEKKSSKTESDSSVSWLRSQFKSPERGEDYSILQTLFSLDMWILFVVTICGLGGTVTAIDNMGQIGESLGYSTRSISTFVALISIWNYAGRVVAGFVSEFLLTEYKFPRTLVLTLVLSLSCVGHLLIAFGVEDSLYVASVFTGFCYGAQWPLIYAIISELFGLKHYATHYNFGAVASPIGSYVLGVRVAGNLYDREARRQNSGSDLKCGGVQCYKLSFLIITGVTVFGALLSLLLVWRTRDFYNKFREQGGQEIGNGDIVEFRLRNCGDDDDDDEEDEREKVKNLESR